MFDYLTGDQEMPADLMEIQLQVALTLLHAGRVHDVIFLGSPIVSIHYAATCYPGRLVAESLEDANVDTLAFFSCTQLAQTSISINGNVSQVDLPLAMVERTRQWIQEHKDEPLPPKLQ